MTSLFRADLHCHTNCSDGTLSPEELVRLAKKINLSGLSITDHDTTEAYSIAAPLCLELGISLITGVEFSTMFEDESVHILGYNFDLHHPCITATCQKHKERRKDRNKQILTLLTKHHMPIREEELIAKHIVGRPHIALAMIKKGYVASVKEAFNKYIGEGCSCYSPGESFDIKEGIDMIHQAGGIAVIAHPHLNKKDNLLKKLLNLPFDGIECYYGNFPPEKHKKWLNIAEEKKWLVTGGSDFHGDMKPGLSLGSSWINEERFQAILNRQI